MKTTFRKRLLQGYSLIAVGTDTLLLGQSARRVLSELKP